VKTVEEKQTLNEWDHVQSFINVLQQMRDGRWTWLRNSRCKYVELRVDMRSGHCIIRDRDGKRINPEDLAFQIDIGLPHPTDAP
jgi:hypothetical protein